MSAFVSLFRSKWFRIILMVVLFIASALIAIAMLLGKESGMFVIRVQEGDVNSSIAITENYEDQTTYGSKLTAKGIENMLDNSPAYILSNNYSTLREYNNVTGNINEESRLYGYTFYIVNTGEGSVGVNATLTFGKVSKKLDEAIRVLTFYELSGDQLDIYQKQDSIDFDYGKYYDEVVGSNVTSKIKTFKSNEVVFDNQQLIIGHEDNNNYVRYTILFWIEGNDPDETDQMMGGTIRFELQLKIAF